MTSAAGNSRVGAHDDAGSESTRRASIVQGARRLFVSEGSSAFSMRGVAKHQGISLGHLQHFFPTKADLLSAMLLYTTESYTRAYESFIESLPDSPELRLRGVVRYLLEDVGNAEVTAFFVEWWPLTSKDPSARDLLSQLYRRNTSDFAHFIAEARPDLSKEKVGFLALQVLALIDGILIYNHTESPSPGELTTVLGEVEGTIYAMVRMTAPVAQ